MSTEGRSAEPAAATRTLESAGFVRLLARADGDALAASGLIASALEDSETPFQVSVERTVGSRSDRVDTPTADDDVTVVIGAVESAPDAADIVSLATADRPATLAAVDLVRELGMTPDPVVALAGIVASGDDPAAGESERLLETARDRGLLERRPGVAIPTADPVDGLAHSTRVHAPWSGDLAATREAIGDVVDGEPADFDADDHRTIGSLVALDVVGADDATDAAAASVGQALRPYATPEAPFATLGGFADVLAATASTDPGTGVALAMGHDVRERALDVWRAHGQRVHTALEDASTGRYDGLFVVGIDGGPVDTVARLGAAYQSPEPVVLAISEGRGPSSNRMESDNGDGWAAIATREADHLDTTLEAVARDLAEQAPEVDVDYDIGYRRGSLRFDPDVDDTTIIATVRDLL